MFSKKTKLLIGTLSLAVVITTITVISFNQSDTSSNKVSADNINRPEKISINSLGHVGSGKVPDKINIKVDFTKPENFKVYKIKKPQLQKSDIENIAKNLGVVDEIKEDDKKYHAKSVDKNLIIDKLTGSITYTTKEWENESEPLKNMNSEQEYRKLAEDFLLEKGLMKKDAIFSGIKVDTRGIYNPATDKYDEMPYQVGVEFRRDLDGVTWTGTGPKLTVYFYGSGVVAVKSVWREAEEKEVGAYPVIELADAVIKLKEGNGLVFTKDESASEVDITKIELVYYHDSLGVEQEYATPYYLLTGEGVNAVVSALPDNVVEFKNHEMTNSSNIVPDKKQ
ncbi:hypothetical protein KZ483_09830 [Paenibacillus sp. sptzw28]|uniref:hypothetical protein n=1 Tax=Paenibacillus sp. sptzw28 TaxID=715179 RepID=UPI001C6ECFD7|nr:hypothetical protein [Paenibacillus sp. sptzw28]QYR23186.1 hypothetical protein KZ483_09830 [Paenibacillus sp. sptzw28]